MDQITEETLAQQQADGLRSLADLITRNPELAEQLRFPLRYLSTPLDASDGDVRGVLSAFHRATTAAGATVTVDNGRDRCKVSARFGPVVVSMSADAALMAGEQPAPAPKYPPLEVTGRA
jgi:hypothetical protein